MSDLQNPGLNAPTKLDFNNWPRLAEFPAFGGVPGVEYLYLCPEELPRAQADGWSTIVRMPFFKLNGVDLTAVARGEPIQGAARGSSVCKLHVSKLAKERTGLGAPTTVDAPPDLNATIAKSKERTSPRTALDKAVGE